MLTPDDIQNGNVLTGPDGDLRVAARVQTDAGQFVILTNENGVGSLIQDGTLYDHEDYSLKSRLAASGVATAQEASEVEAMRSEMARLTKLTEALLQERNAPDPGPVPEPEVPVQEVPGPAALPPEADGQDVVISPLDTGTAHGPASGAGGVPNPPTEA